MKGATVNDVFADRAPSGPRVVARAYSQNATVHGLKYAATTERSLVRRMVWVIVFAGAFAGLVYTLVIQLAGLTSNPTHTYQTIEVQPSLPFPAVTLCNLNQIPKYLVETDETLSQLLLATSALSGFANYNLSLFSNASFSEDPLRFTKPGTWPTLQQCSWNNKIQNCSELFVTQKTDFGYCFTFNGRNGSSTSKRRSTRPGTKYGLSVIANIFQEQYTLGLNTDSAGMRVLLHDTEETPLVEGRGFDVSPGAATTVSLSMTKVTNLPPPYTTLTGASCINTTQTSFVNSLKYFDVYDSKACIFECRLDFIISRCHCKAIYDPGNAPLCSPLQLLTCYVEVFESFDGVDLNRDCNCPVPCEMNLFTPQLSMSAYPSLALMKEVNTLFEFNLTEDEYRRDVLKINFAYDSFMLQSVVQVPQYSLESVISTLGGQMGMFLGASLLSVVEFLDFLTHVLISKWPGSAAQKG